MIGNPEIQLPNCMPTLALGSIFNSYLTLDTNPAFGKLELKTTGLDMAMLSGRQLPEREGKERNRDICFETKLGRKRLP